MSRLSAVGSVPIADRIKAFDNGSSKSKSRKVTSPPPRNSPQPSSPLFKTFPRDPKTQFSAKDPTRPSSTTSNPPSRSASRSSLGSVSSLGKDESPATPISTTNTPPVKNILKSASSHSVLTSSRTEKTVVTVEHNDDKVSSGSLGSRSSSKSQESQILTRNDSKDSFSKLRSVKEDAGEVLVKGDTVDRAKPRRSIIEICQESPIPQKFSNNLKEEEVSVNNNNKATLRNANNSAGSHLWSKTGNGTSDNHDIFPSGVGGREDKVYSFSSDSEELPSFSSSVTDEGEVKEVKDLRKAKREVDMRLVDREDQVEDLAQQVDMLLSVKARLEAELTQCRKEHKREVADKDDELEDTRASAAKKIKILEQQLELEHEERLGFLRERHELEGKIMALKDELDHGSSEEQVRKLKKDLKRSKALLKDAQLMLDKNNQEGINKIVLRQLKNQLEDAEFARTAAMKGRANTELELVEVNSMLEDMSRVKTELEEKLVKVGREKADLAQQLKENEEEMAELLKKYKASVAACSVDQITIQDQAVTIQQLEAERNRARELLAEMEVRVEHSKGEQVSVAQHRRLELRLREMDSKLELEKTGKSRLEVQVARLKEVIEKLSKEGEVLRSREKTSMEEMKKMSKAQRELKEDLAAFQGKDADFGQKKVDMEKMLEVAEAETIIAKNELKVAQRRIEDLQAAIQGDMDTSAGDSECESDGETEVWLDQARRRMGLGQTSNNSNSQHNSLSITGHNSLTDLADKSFSTVSSIDSRDVEQGS